MILHALAPSASAPPPQQWWAVHAETLTPVFIDASRLPALTIRIHLAAHPPESIRSHPKAVADPKIIAIEIQRSTGKLLDVPGISYTACKKSPSHPDSIPDYLAVFDSNGEHPAIWRTGEPAFVIPANPHQENMLGAPSHFRSATDLPVEGWTYWWEDAQRAWDEILPRFIQAAG